MNTARVPGRTAGVPEPADASSRGVRLYSVLLRAYPAGFRRRYGNEMVVLFSDQLREARTQPAAATGVWLRTLVDLASSAVGEHLRRDRTVAQSLATFEPTRPMRLAGLLAVIGGVLLLWAFLTFEPFGDRHANAVRLVCFWTAGMAVVLAFHRRQAAGHPRLALAATGSVVLLGAWNVAWLLLAWDRPSPFMGDFGFLGFVASFLAWLAAGFYGAAVLLMRSAWLGMRATASAVTRTAAVILAPAGPVATFGMDRLGLVDSEPYGDLFGTLGAIGVGGVGLGWLLLGLVLVLGGRRAAAA